LSVENYMKKRGKGERGKGKGNEKDGERGGSADADFSLLHKCQGFIPFG
jgi:hypothetical protein